MGGPDALQDPPEPVGPAQRTFVGLQSYSDYRFTTAFRNIRATVLK